MHFAGASKLHPSSEAKNAAQNDKRQSVHIRENPWLKLLRLGLVRVRVIIEPFA
jgi:hypothetical protein